MILENDAVKSSRQILFITKVAGDKYYSCCGTAFLIHLKGHLFAVTAKHVLTKQKYNPKSFHIRYNDQGRELIQFDTMFFLTTSLTEDSDHVDILFFKVSEKLFRYNVNSSVIINLDAFEEFDYSDGDKILVTGFPDVVADINYEGKVINHFRQPFEGGKVKKSGYQDVYEFKYSAESDSVKLKLSGMSGAPVFLYKENGTCKGLAGILLRHSFFLSAKNIHKYLNKILENLHNQTLNTDLLKLAG